jgi:spermidine synthase
VNDNWFVETLHGPYGQGFEIAGTLFHSKTEFQELTIFETEKLGRVLVLDGAVQTTERDEFYYHEMIIHPALLAHGEVKRVLIIGGGDGGALREALKHPGIEQVTQVEIDPSVTELCREHMPRLSDGAFDDPRARLIFTDGVKFVADTDEQFDVMVVDSTDPVGPAIQLFEDPFYRNCRRVLGPRGILVRQAGVPFLQHDEFVTTHKKLGAAFKDAAFLRVAVPTYCAGDMALAWASDDVENRTRPVDELERRYRASGIKTKYYNPWIHRAAFALPNFMLDALAAN